MCRTVCFKVSSGMDAAVKVMTTLRRKQFDVKQFSMRELENSLAELRVTIEDANQGDEFEKAVLQVKKLVGVSDIQEAC